MTTPRCRLRLIAAALIACACAPSLASTLNAIVTVEPGRAVPPRIPRDRFMVEPVVTSVVLSPDGRHVAWLRRQGSDNGLWLAKTDRIAPRRLLRRVEADRLRWSHDGRWLFLTGARAIRAVSIDGTAGAGVIVGLDRPDRWRVVGADPWQPAALLLLETQRRFGMRDPIGTRLWRVEPGGRRQLVAFARRRIIDVAMRPDGRVGFAKLVDGDRHLVLGRRENGRFRVVTRCVALHRCDLLGSGADGRTLYLRGDLDGDLQGVLAIHADGRIERLHQDPAGLADIDDVALDPAAGTPVIAAYRGPRPFLAGLTRHARVALLRLEHRLPGREHRIQPSSGPIWLVQERGSRLQGVRWHLFDTRSGTMRLLVDDPGTSGRVPLARLAPVYPVDYPASDGMRLHGLLTLPPGRDPARAPLVVFVHGGPWTSDTADYSAQTQLLANRGYIVFRPQYRGSAGYGRRYLFAARGDFGNGRVQRDIEDGTRWLLARHIGDPHQVVIVGASYGGYAVLQALSEGSSLYRAGIAVVPPPDFGRTIMRMARRGVGGEYQGIDFSARLRALDLDPANHAIMARLSRQAPSERIGRLSAPLTIIAAERDDRVALRDVLDYAARARLAGKPIDAIVARGQPHAPEDILPRRAMLFLLDEALARYLAQPPADAPIALVRKWMANKLRRGNGVPPDPASCGRVTRVPPKIALPATTI